ncbi:hypothetical protein B0T13DRAFT_485423 [Neurospora crassa]|nr:hypothetical protein B0T13DRAFT_485423 [Neurospora crassa]
MFINWSKLVDVGGCIESSSQQSSTAVGIMSSVHGAVGGSLFDRRSRVRVSDAKNRLAGGGGHGWLWRLVALRAHIGNSALCSLSALCADDGNVACMEAFVVASVRMSYRATVGDDGSCKEVTPYREKAGGRDLLSTVHSAKHLSDLDGAAARKTPKFLLQAAKSHQTNKAGRIHPAYLLPPRQRIPPLSSSSVGCPASCFGSRKCQRHGHPGTIIKLNLTATQSLGVVSSRETTSYDRQRRNSPRTANDALFLSLYPEATYLLFRRPSLLEARYSSLPSYIRAQNGD